MRNENKFALAAIMLGLCALSGSNAFAGAAATPEQEEDLDTIVLAGKGATIPPTKVTQDNYIQVVGQYKGSTIKKESYLVKDIIYADKDSNYQTALDKREEGRYTLAALYFSKALETLKDRKWAAEYCNYGLGNAFFLYGVFDGYKGRTRSYDPAVEYFKRALEANPKSRYMLDIVPKIAICYAEMKKIPEAEAAVKDAESRIKKYRDEAGKLGAGYNDAADKAMVQLAMARARIAEESVALKMPGIDAATTRDLWHAARTKAKNYPDLQGECVEGELRALIDMKQYEEAKAEATNIIDKFNQQNDYSMMALLPAAYNARGMAYLAQALDYEGKKNKPLADSSFAEARWDFLNVIAQFFDNDEYVAAAHYRAGICYEKLQTVEPTDAKQKAIREWKSILVNFPKSEYKDKAVAKLKEHGVTIEEEKKPEAAQPPAAPPPAAPPTPEKPDPKKKPAKK